MDIQLNEVQARILGSLVEKSTTTPDHYPLTLNALCMACNQKSNREPVTTFREEDVVRGLDGLRDMHLASQIAMAGSRVPKYAHRIENHFAFSSQELGALCVLILRGPQTAAEVRSRTNRLCEFSNVEEAEQVLRTLEQREDGPFVVQLPRQPGRRERRFMHLFCGPVDMAEEAEIPPEPATLAVRAENERITALETEVTALRDELTRMRHDFSEFRKQFV